jgi:hypothetical protein
MLLEEALKEAGYKAGEVETRGKKTTITIPGTEKVIKT